MNTKIRQGLVDMLNNMDHHLRKHLCDDRGKIWEHTFIFRQIEKRRGGGNFTLKDHIRAMVYSMLSGGTAWDRFAAKADPDTKYITPVDKVFHDYDPDTLLACTPEQLQQGLKDIQLLPRFIARQMEALLSVNIPKLKKWAAEYGSVDRYYQQFIDRDKGRVAPLSIVQTLANPDSPDKLAQMDIALVCEYLRNVGYDFPKPDTHIRRILGRDILGLSASREVSPTEAIKIVFNLAKASGRLVAETDYILWSYCATGYGEICTAENPKCDKCVAIRQCKRYAKDVLDVVKSEYILTSRYGIKEADGVSDIIMKAAHIAYLEFHRRLRSSPDMSMEDRGALAVQVKKLLAERIPDLLTVREQAAFDQKHHAICLDILRVYEPFSKQGYGIAQRWVNGTLTHLIIIESSLASSKLPVMQTRKFFHVPVDQGNVLKVATAQGKDRFYHGLGLKAAPLRHDTPDVYEMGWYQLGKSQPFADWEYQEYMEFQLAVRNALKDAIKDGTYKDVADWVLQAAMEVKG